MAVFFSDKELVEFAIGIERNGAAYYRKLSAGTQINVVKDVLNYLSGEEEKHVRIFQSLAASTGEFQPSESYPGEYRQYLQALIDNTVFTDLADAEQRAGQISDADKAIDIGIQAEKDSIVFYTEMQNYISKSHQTIVQEILTEEKTHLKKLAELKKIIKEE